MSAVSSTWSLIEPLSIIKSLSRLVFIIIVQHIHLLHFLTRLIKQWIIFMERNTSSLFHRSFQFLFHLIGRNKHFLIWLSKIIFRKISSTRYLSIVLVDHWNSILNDDLQRFSFIQWNIWLLMRLIGHPLNTIELWLSHTCIFWMSAYVPLFSELFIWV